MFIILLVRILLAFLILVARTPDGWAQQQCGLQEYHLSADRRVLNISSPNYPNAFARGSSCRYRIIAPLDHVVVLNCNYEVYPNICSGAEIFFVSRDGDFEFRDGVSYCSSSNIRSTSHFRALTVGYQSAATSQQNGRFFCQASSLLQRCDCGWRHITRISNGQQAVMHEYPSMVALRDVSSSQRVFCGGSIVSHRMILTAAHCMRVQPDARLVRALVGDHDLTSSTESRFSIQHVIQRIISHPGYSASTMANDIALLVTQRNIEWTRGVGPICLPWRQATESFSYLNVDVTGWGTLSFGGPKSNTLQKVELLTMENQPCQVEYNVTATILPSHLCTYDYMGRGQDSCQYDSGGPVIYKQRQRMFLVGIISFGRTCGTRYAIGINTRITSHLNWIRSYVGGAVCVV